MEKVFLLVFLAFFVSGCTSQPQQAGTTNGSQAGEIDTAPRDSFSEIQREINVLYQDGNLIGLERYGQFKTALDTFESQVAPSEIADLRQKLEALIVPRQVSGQQPSGEHPQTGTGASAEFDELKRVITALYTDRNIIGEDRYQQFNTQLDSFERQGLYLNEIPDLRQKLEALNPSSIGTTGSTTSPDPDAAILAQLPECTGQKFSLSPVDLNEILEISPMGNINPPGHTLPTPHLYLHISFGQSSTKIIPLKAPGEIYLIGITSSSDDIVPSREEYSIGFALCKDVFGYFDHVKELSADAENFKRDSFCNEERSSPGCTLVKKVTPGTVLGGVGHVQGNFDFGAYDYRMQLDYANPASYGDLMATGLGKPRLLSVVCPIDLYPDSAKSQFYSKISRTVEPRCGNVMQDVKATLQGGWFYDRGRADLEWDKHLMFGHDNENPSQAIIAVAGIISDPIRKAFSPSSSGQTNRKFSDVTPDGKIYCYDVDGARLIVQMETATKIKIEKQSGGCGTGMAFTGNAKVYQR